MALREFLTLSCLARRGLEGRTMFFLPSGTVRCCRCYSAKKQRKRSTMTRKSSSFAIADRGNNSEKQRREQRKTATTTSYL